MRQMTEKQKAALKEMDLLEIMDFQIRLQVQCDMTDQEAAEYISQAFEDDK